MTPRRLLMLVLVLLLGAGAVIGLRVSGATYVDDSTTDSQVTAANDWTPPLVAVTSPGATVIDSATVAATASDARGTVVSVTLEHRRAGDSAWSVICTDTSDPWSCTWDTTSLADGSQELRASATDDSGNRGVSAIVTTEVTADAGYVTLRDPGDLLRGSVTLRASSSLWFNVIGYVFEYAPAGTSSWTTACTTSAYGLFTATCTWDTSSLSGSHDLRVRASTPGSGSAVSVVRDVMVDNTGPVVTLDVPSGPLGGTVQLGADVDEPHSGLASVSVQTRAAGGTWTSCGTGVASPFSCSFDTTKVLDGSYEFRAVATDRAGNQTTTAAVTRTVTNVTGTVSVTSPTAGATVRGNAVTVSAAASAVRGVASVRFEVKPAGSASWILLCTTTTAPYSCTADSTTAPQGGFEVRAVMTDRAGAFHLSSVVAVTVDNTPPRAHDVQVANGGALGRADAGDRLVLTFTDEITLGSIKPGWTSGSTSLTPTFHDRSASGSANTTRDNLSLAGTRLGSVSFAQNYVNDRAVVSYAGSSMVAATATVNGATVTVVTITLATPGSGGLAPTSTMTGATSWAPGLGLLSPDGLAASTTAVTESGTTDRDF